MWRMPMTTIVTMLGMVSMLVPPFGMLLSKWIAMEASVGSPAILVLTIAGSAFTVVFLGEMDRPHSDGFVPPDVQDRESLALHALDHAASGGGRGRGRPGAVEIYKSAIVPLSAEAYGVAPSDKLLAGTAGVLSYPMVWPLLAMPGAAILLWLVSFRRFKASSVKLPFLCGENIEDGIPRYSFRSVADRGETAWAASNYLRDVMTEGRLTLWSNLIAAVVLAAMFGVIR